MIKVGCNHRKGLKCGGSFGVTTLLTKTKKATPHLASFIIWISRFANFDVA